MNFLSYSFLTYFWCVFLFFCIECFTTMSRLLSKEVTIYNQQNDGVRPSLKNARKTRIQTFQEAIKRNKNYLNYFKDIYKATFNRPKSIERQEKEEEANSLWKISQISKRNSNVLFRAKAVFPFDFFPSELIITATQIEVKNNVFFSSFSDCSIPLQDPGYIQINKSIFFASLRIFNIRSTEPIIIDYLKANDAIKAKDIIRGLLIAQESGVDVSVIETHMVLPQLEQLGRAII